MADEAKKELLISVGAITRIGQIETEQVMENNNVKKKLLYGR